MSQSQDYESWLSERNEHLCDQLGRAKGLLETLVKINEQGWSKDDPAYRIAMRSARKFLEAQ